MSVQDFLTFVDNSPTPWHAVAEVKQRLESAGFEEVAEKNLWSLKPGHRYFVIRQGTSLCAFIMPEKQPQRCLIAAAHTDSPGFKLKPNAEYRQDNMVMLGLEVYGGPLLTSWLNRDLGIAGRVVCKERDSFVDVLVRLEEHPVVIPQLAIHLDRNVNEHGLVLNKQDQLAALMGTASEKTKTLFLKKALKKILKKEPLGCDLFVYPLEKAALVGNGLNLIAGYRLDNLCGVHAALTGFLSSKKSSSHTVKMLTFWDHEEIGSDTAQGAGSPFLAETIERIAGSRERFFCLVSQSHCVSIDVGHALHPNYRNKHEPHHALLLNQGIILKSSAQYKYATDARSGALVEELCKKGKLPLQRFASRGDLPSGSTIGPIAACVTGMSTVDIGIPQLSMHSARELIGVKDQQNLASFLSLLFV